MNKDNVAARSRFMEAFCTKPKKAFVRARGVPRALWLTMGPALNRGPTEEQVAKAKKDWQPAPTQRSAEAFVEASMARLHMEEAANGA